MEVMEKMRQIVIARSGVVPGKRTFRTELFRRYNLVVNVKRIARLMKRMKLVAKKPQKDAYKHQATHDHVCASPANEVAREFFIGPRKVILTDITYLYFGRDRSLFYLCVFRDAYTRENLGWHAGNRMDVGLVRAAYDKMMVNHGKELKKSHVFVHHDQGSQYLSTDFRQLLSDDGFIQSVSARGNSQDNAPMESFFGRMKTDMMDLIARCNSQETAIRLVYGYLEAYNGQFFQYELSGLTPTEFYDYATTGVYPLDNYFGVPAELMMAVDDLKNVRRTYADEEARKRREASDSERTLKRMIDPKDIISRDKLLLNRLIGKCERTKNKAVQQQEHLKTVLEQAKAAMEYVSGLAQEKLDELRDPLVWKNYEQLNYVFAMTDLF
jgi:transposase InsO family protein